MDNLKLPTYQTKIFCFINSVKRTDYNHVIALCEDGHCLAEHLSSNGWFARHDIGINSDNQHELYQEHCPNGYELIWVYEVEGHSGIDAAYAKNQELAAKATIKL